jgi:Domain of unknown function (DUF6457)
MTGSEWIARFAAAIGAVEPTAEEYERILELAAEAAHASERTAAPVACWLAAAAGVPLDRALETAAGIAGRP